MHAPPSGETGRRRAGQERGRGDRETGLRHQEVSIVHHIITLPPIREAWVDRVGVGVGVLGTAGDLGVQELRLICDIYQKKQGET